MSHRQAGCHPEPDSGPSHFLVCSDHTTCYYDDLVKHETAGRVGNVCSVWYIATAKWSHTLFFRPGTAIRVHNQLWICFKIMVQELYRQEIHMADGKRSPGETPQGFKV